MNALPQTKTVRLGGKDYPVKELTFGDLADLQDAGVDLEKIANDAREAAAVAEAQAAAAARGEPVQPSRGPKIKLRDMGRILWTKIRRRDSEDKPWRPSLDHLLHSCTPEEITEAMSVAMAGDSAPLPQRPEPSTG